MRMRRQWLVAGVVVAALVAVDAGRADENLTGYVKGAEALPKGASELYFIGTHHGGKRAGRYEAQALSLEYEYGLSDRLTAAVYVNGYRHDYRDPVPGEIEGRVKKEQLSGGSLELKYMLLSPYKDPIGMALYGEVTYDTVDSITGEKVRAWEYETRLILHSVYLDGEMHWLNNIELEGETSELDDGSLGQSAIAPRYRSALSYRVIPNWFIGVEGWIDAEMLKPDGEAWEFDHWDFFAGPNIHYGAKHWWATLAYVYQVAGSDERDSARTNQHLADHEKYEIRLKVGYNF